MLDNTPLPILLLEDHGLVRAGFKALMKMSMPQAQVFEAADYAEAIAILDSTRIDFAFLDLNLAGASGKTGMDVLHYIRAQALETRAVMISGGDAVSGYLGQDKVLQCLEAGAFGYIPKAMEGENVMREAFESVLKGRVFLPASVMQHRNSTLPSAKSPEDLGVNGRLLEVLYFVCQGDTNKTIAGRMGLTDGSVRDYVSRLLKQFQVKNRTQLLVEVARLGMAIVKP